MGDISIIIPTRNRQDILVGTMRDVLNQSLLPNEVIIVDSSNINSHTEMKDSLIELFKNSGVSIEIIHSSPGLPLQRNIGIDKISIEKGLIFFFDDDVELPTNYLQSISEYFDNFKEVDIALPFINEQNRISKGRGRNLLRKFFYLPHYSYSGYMQKSGFPVFPFRNKLNGCKIDIICGIFTARKKVFDSLRFDENLTEWAYMEDVDFGSRASENFNIEYIPSISCTHIGLGTIKKDKLCILRMMVYNHWYLFNKNRHIYDGNQIYYLWALFGIGMISISESIKLKNISPIKGFILGVMEILNSPNARRR